LKLRVIFLPPETNLSLVPESLGMSPVANDIALAISRSAGKSDKR
jgi:hypothetical protein